MNLEEIFHNKELCDTLRDINKNSAASLDDAYLYIKDSDNYERDSFIIKRLVNRGVRRDIILIVIQALTDRK